MSFCRPFYRWWYPLRLYNLGNPYGVEMACKKRWRAWFSAVKEPRSVFLGLIGVLLFVAGVFLFPHTPIFIMGVAVLVLGVVLPVASDVEIGPQGIQFKTRTRAKDAEFRPFVLAEQESLQRCAVLLGIPESGAPDIVKEALARSYVHWSVTPEEERWMFVLCTLVHVVLGMRTLGLVQAQQNQRATHIMRGEELRILQVLGMLETQARAVVVLRHYEDQDESQIARILERPVDEVQSDLHRAEEEIRSLVSTLETPT